MGLCEAGSALTLPVGPQPLHVVCPEQYTQPPPTQSHRTDLMIDCQPPPVSYRRAEVLTLPFKRRYEKIEIMPEVSSGFPQESREKTMACFWVVSAMDEPKNLDP